MGGAAIRVNPRRGYYLPHTLFMTSAAKFFILLLVFVLAASVLNYTGWLISVKGLIASPFTGLQGAFWRSAEGIFAFFGAVARAPGLAQELANYQVENHALRAELARLEVLRRENETLRQTLKLGLPKSFQFAEVQIIGLDAGSDLVFIDRGSAEGILKGQPVITGQGAVAGRVAEVFQHRSAVMLISHTGSAIPARALGKNFSALLKGAGRGRAVLQDLPKEAQLAPGDTIVSAALAGFYPQNLLLGEVMSLDHLDIQPFASAAVKPFYLRDPAAILFVIINF